MVSPSPLRTKSGVFRLPADRQLLTDRFNPGHWLDRREIAVSSCIAISGCYERRTPLIGGFYSEDTHFFSLALRGRPADTSGYLVDCYREPQPAGEVIFVPAGFRYIGSGGVGTQRNLYVFLHARAGRDEEDMGAAEDFDSSRVSEFMNLRSERVRFLLTQINQELYNPGFASELMLEGLSTTLLAETARLLRQAQEAPVVKGGLAPVNLRRIRERVLDRNNPPSLEELAVLCNLSRRHLMRGFRESTGQTIGQFIQQVTLEKARHLLRNTDKAVSQIASELGFESTSAFSSAFRRLTGESPRAFRARESSYERGLKDLRFATPRH